MGPFEQTLVTPRSVQIDQGSPVGKRSCRLQNARTINDSSLQKEIFRIKRSIGYSEQNVLENIFSYFLHNGKWIHSLSHSLVMKHRPSGVSCKTAQLYLAFAGIRLTYVFTKGRVLGVILP